MAADQFPRYRAGDRPSAGAMNRQAEASEREASTFGALGAGRVDLPGGAGPTPGPPGSFWIRITAAAAAGACPNAYAWEEVTRPPGACVYIAPGDGRRGTAADLPAYEVNGNAAVPIGRVVRAWPAADQRSVEFAYCCTS